MKQLQTKLCPCDTFCMATDPKDISLSERQKQKLAELEAATGTPWQEVLGNALDHEADQLEIAKKLAAGAKQAENGDLHSEEDVFARLLHTAEQLDAQ